jgi:hypothetical protein
MRAPLFDPDCVAVCAICGRHLDEYGPEAMQITRSDGWTAFVHRGCFGD